MTHRQCIPVRLDLQAVNGYWTTRGCHRRVCVLSFPFWRHLRDRELSSPRLAQSATSPRVDQSARCPVRELAIRELAYPRVVQLPCKPRPPAYIRGTACIRGNTVRRLCGETFLYAGRSRVCRASLTASDRTLYTDVCSSRSILSVSKYTRHLLSFAICVERCPRRQTNELARYESVIPRDATVFNLHHLPLAHPLGVTPFEFCRDFRLPKSRVPGLSCEVVCVILRLAVSVEHRLVTDEQTDTRRQLIPALTSVDG